MAAISHRLRMNLDHRWASPRLSEYVDDDLSRAQRHRLERHAEVCPECGPLLRGLAVTVFRLRQLRFRRGGSVAPRVIERLRVEQAWR